MTAAAGGSTISNRAKMGLPQPRHYTHDPAVLIQFAQCRQLSPNKLLNLIETKRDDKNRLKEETLVMLARDFSRRGKDVLAWRVVQSICERVQASIVRSLKLWRLTPSASEDMVESVVSTLYEQILDIGSSAQLFWEIRFWTCFERLLLSAVKRYRLVDDRIEDLNTTASDTERWLTDAARGRSDWKDPALRAIVAEGLAQLPDTLRTAFMLKHWAGFPEYSADPNDLSTIAKILGVTDRTVRNYLTRAEQLLNEWRGEAGDYSVDNGGEL